MSKKKFPFYRQLDYRDCGPTCLRMIAKFHGKSFSREFLRDKASITRQGVTMAGIADAAEIIEMRTLGIRISLDSLVSEAPTPFIVSWRQKHFVVVYKTSKTKIFVADPAHGLVEYTHKDFHEAWTNSSDGNGFALLLEPNTNFYNLEEDKSKKKGFSFLIPYIKPYKKLISQLFLGLLVGIVIQFITPFLMQSIVDTGVNTQNIPFIYLILIAQLVLFISQTLVRVFREWLLIHITNRVHIKMISDFLFKMLKLPITFFETRNTGEHLQRIQDHARIQNFVSSSTFGMVYSILLFIVFSFVLAYYNSKIFLVFFIGAILYVAWTFFFLKKRAELDFKRFDENSQSQTSLVQIINGVKEIKINNSQRKNRWKWEQIQISLFKTSISSLALAQYQSIGSGFINELKNIVITFLSATAVVNGDITLGMMLSIQYIVGQLNSPLSSFIGFIQVWQDAKISLERLMQVHTKKDEDELKDNKVKDLPSNRSIVIKDLSFRYGGKSTPFVLKNINCTLHEGKTTAIVGASGSGKTTLLKLLLKFHKPTEGNIHIGSDNLNNIHNDFWRMNCGAVMQDTFIFNDTIAGNISESEQNEIIDRDKLKRASYISNIEEFIDRLPNKYNTELGTSGIRLSGGQEQRLMIARAVYKNPSFVFFDEATSSLDANNERVIMEKLNDFIKNRTSVIVAHRLSTVKNADNIIVLENGEIVEQGNHEKLTAKKGKYYELVKNQLELGK
ncbi:ATP-binding cassette subfamily B protein [Mesoflavibacter sabulilitoris]|uniref:ABC transporter ATP-binding protein n=1 Tax=Mesoflavibacter zeaxanthinifaciens subsp. sabulilitoris TaxID=1520893 RepID=A0A2T1N5X8_9FLAO|nr:peptidase domain-containing ABC transporter [Mesoflavibacter zeaxanthinifaciens]MBB3123372.1 ATP-binding cassette subfamily B protein [Mesoflavibacter zeaxanthinifaciens subsp. sabulilitoris]PSG86996.1 ABC transporter ATP-binding protein [Mesoflavibacter zeaxanthinifaciens subsp. sabulilitoris]